MARQIKVSDSIKFTSDADSGRASGMYGNVDGRLKESYYHKLYDFDDKAIDETNDWTSHVGNGGISAINVAANGTLRLSANTGADDNVAEIIGQAVIYAQQAPSIEFRIKVNNIVTVGIAVGLFDNAVNTNDQIKCELDSDNAAIDRGTTPNFVGFCFDTDATLDYWYCVNDKAGTQGAFAAAGNPAPVNATYEVFRIDLDKDGNAAYYRNGACVGAKASAVTNTTALAPYAGLITRGASAARTLDIDYFEVWQKRGETSAILA